METITKSMSTQEAQTEAAVTEPLVLDEAEMQQFIRDCFEENFEMMQIESGAALSPDVKEAALQQVLLYWRKLRNIAESITETEVKLNLPSQKTPKGREFGIEGVVDIVRDDQQTIMYDIKTHDADYVRNNQNLYEAQLNVYAHIWQNLRGHTVDKTAIIATAYPEQVKNAVIAGDMTALDYELTKWQPIVDITFDPLRVEDTIKDFGEVVDKIENGEFHAPPVTVLNSRTGNSKVLFATNVCRNCDARFSCISYRQYAMQGRNPNDDSFFTTYLPSTGTELEQEEWLTTNLEARQNVEE